MTTEYTVYIVGPVAHLEFKTPLNPALVNDLPYAGVPFQAEYLPTWLDRLMLWDHDDPRDGPVMGYELPFT